MTCTLFKKRILKLTLLEIISRSTSINYFWLGNKYFPLFKRERYVILLQNNNEK